MTSYRYFKALLYRLNALSVLAFCQQSLWSRLGNHIYIVHTVLPSQKFNYGYLHPSIHAINSGAEFFVSHACSPLCLSSCFLRILPCLSGVFTTLVFRNEAAGSKQLRGNSRHPFSFVTYLG